LQWPARRHEASIEVKQAYKAGLGPGASTIMCSHFICMKLLRSQIYWVIKTIAGSAKTGLAYPNVLDHTRLGSSVRSGMSLWAKPLPD